MRSESEGMCDLEIGSGERGLRDGLEHKTVVLVSACRCIVLVLRYWICFFHILNLQFLYRSVQAVC